MKLHTMIQETGIALILMMLCFSQSISAQSNLVFNGGFDTNAAGWILTNRASWPWGGNPGSGFAIGLDNVNPSSSTDPMASQTINGLMSGEIYIVSGDYQESKDRGGGSPSDPSFGVAINDVFLFEAVAQSPFMWQSFSFSYTAISSSALLSLSSQINGTGISYLIDNISMEAVPEPFSSLLILLGSGVLIYVRRRYID